MAIVREIKEIEVDMKKEEIEKIKEDMIAYIEEYFKLLKNRLK